jgi:hypothetical protein
MISQPTRPRTTEGRAGDAERVPPDLPLAALRGVLAARRAGGRYSVRDGGGASGGGWMRVTKSGARGVRFEGAEERGRAKAWLTVAAEIFSVAPSMPVVDVRKDAGDNAQVQLLLQRGAPAGSQGHRLGRRTAACRRRRVTSLGVDPNLVVVHCLVSVHSIYHQVIEL